MDSATNDYHRFIVKQNQLSLIIKREKIHENNYLIVSSNFNILFCTKNIISNL